MASSRHLKEKCSPIFHGTNLLLININLEFLFLFQEGQLLSEIISYCFILFRIILYFFASNIFVYLFNNLL